MSAMNSAEPVRALQCENMVLSVLDQRRARVAKQLFQRIFPGKPVASEHLQRVRGNIESGLGRGDLGSAGCQNMRRRR